LTMTSRRPSHRASAKTRSSSWSCAPPSGRRRGSTRPRWEPWTRPRVTHMRLEILNNGYGLGAKVLFAMIRVFSGQPMPDAARLVFYRPRVLRDADERSDPRGDARALPVVGRGQGADGRLRLKGERVCVLHRSAHRGGGRRVARPGEGRGGAGRS